MLESGRDDNPFRNYLPDKPESHTGFNWQKLLREILGHILVVLLIELIRHLWM
jgi:hypothetical protein